MRAADKVSFVYTMDRAYCDALRAARAKSVVYSCQIVFDLYSAVRTGLFALHTADTTVRADLSGESALVVIGALNDHSRGIVYKLDNIIGTFAGTYSTSNAFSWINMRYTVEETDSILGTYPYTVAVSKTSKGTSLVAAI